MEGVVDMHVGHDLVGAFHQVVGHLVGADLGEAEVRLGIDEARVDGHAFGVDDLRA